MEIKITIIGEGSNTVKEFKGEEALTNSAIYISELAGLELVGQAKKASIGVNSDENTSKTDENVEVKSQVSTSDDTEQGGTSSEVEEDDESKKKEDSVDSEASSENNS